MRLHKILAASPPYLMVALALLGTQPQARASYIPDLTNPGPTLTLPENGITFIFPYVVSILVSDERVKVTDIIPTFRFESGDGDDAIVGVSLFDPNACRGGTLTPTPASLSLCAFGVNVTVSPADVEKLPESGTWSLTVEADFQGLTSGIVTKTIQTVLSGTSCILRLDSVVV